MYIYMCMGLDLELVHLLSKAVFLSTACLYNSHVHLHARVHVHVPPEAVFFTALGVLVALPCLFDLACFFLSSFSSLI